MKQIALAVGFTLFLSASSRGEEQVENPKYASWSKFKPGTFIAIQNSMISKQRTIIVVNEHKLATIERDLIVLHTTTYTSIDGRKTFTPAVRSEIPRLIPKSELPNSLLPTGKSEGNVEEGTKILTISGVEYKTKWYRNKDKVGVNEFESQFWVSDELPEKILKSESTGPGGRDPKFLTEVLEFKKP